VSLVHREIKFEDAIEQSLMDSGLRKGDPSGYRRDLALDTGELFAFLGRNLDLPRIWGTTPAIDPLAADGDGLAPLSTAKLPG
jgi:hypothetical protein